MISRVAFFALVLSLLVPPQSWAQDSTYTRIGDCSARRAPAGMEYLNAFMACEGYGGWAVYKGSTNQAERLAYGDRGLVRQLSQTPIRSTVGLASTAETIEWRTRGRQPYAVIARWTARRGPTRLEEYLVVSALDARNGACHLAYVDVTEVSNANDVARRIADRSAPGFTCGTQAPTRIGMSEARRLMAGG
ncbi:hypothetical protein NHF45_01505 [Maricaulaceae bacterium NA33B04]|nr:hypothetical protein [Maricaulaceae bacterium NA33B04]